MEEAGYSSLESINCIYRVENSILFRLLAALGFGPQFKFYGAIFFFFGRSGLISEKLYSLSSGLGRPLSRVLGYTLPPPK